MKFKIGECYEIHDYVNFRNRSRSDVQVYAVIKSRRFAYADHSHPVVIGRVWRLSRNSYRFSVNSPSRLRYHGPIVGRATTADQAVQKAVQAFRNYR
jgi:hypothetical protein